MYNPKNCIEHSSKIRTIRDAINLKAPTLGEFKRQYGREWVIGYVSMWLMDLNQTTSVKNKMSDIQIEFTASRIYDTYSLKITDLTLFFRNIKEGVYGSFYETLSSEKVLGWLSEYFDMRCEYAQMQNHQNPDTFNPNSDKMHPEIIKKMFEGVGDVEVQHEKGHGLGTRFKKRIDNE